MQLAAARKFAGCGIHRPHAHLPFFRIRTQGGLSKACGPSSAQSIRCSAFDLGSSASMSSGSLQYPKPTIIPARRDHTASVVWLHGLGDTASGWSFLPTELGNVDHIKFIFPTAPRRPISLNMGFVMTGWYDVKSLEKLDVEDQEGLLESKRYILDLVQQEVAAGIPASRVLVGGFSQGGAISLLSLRSDVKLAGVVGFSTYLALHTQPPVVSDTNKNTPVLMCHGDSDQVIAFRYGKKSADMLREAGVANLTFNVYPGMAHSACPEEFAELRKFINKVLPAKLPAM